MLAYSKYQAQCASITFRHRQRGVGPVASLIVLRGNSGSGKSTIASLLQRELGALAAVLAQDHFCWAVYREPDQRGMAHAQLMKAAAKHCLTQGHAVILDLQRLALFANAPEDRPALLKCLVLRIRSRL
ncbi:AAA family ATPase [Glutamicibacter uratoxydans]|uniref:AAA family ATPase n=1 Tax=Glutamicibacter uratoxydans TaxID=43667 RepID=UPI001143AF13